MLLFNMLSPPQQKKLTTTTTNKTQNYRQCISRAPVYALVGRSGGIHDMLVVCSFFSPMDISGISVFLTLL